MTMADVPPGARLDLGNGIQIVSAAAYAEHHKIHVVVYLREDKAVRDYSVAVHLVKYNPPRDARDILAQADARHPVAGWYPTSCWRVGEIVRDDYLLSIPQGSQPAGIRVGMYRTDDQGQFLNTSWLFLPLSKE